MPPEPWQCSAEQPTEESPRSASPTGDLTNFFAGLALPTAPACVSCLVCALILVWLASCHELSRQTVNLRHYTLAHLNQCRLSTSSTSELHQSCPARPLLDSRLRRRRLQLYPTHWPLLSLARPPGLPAATPHPHPARCHSPPSLPTTDVRRLAAAPHRSTASQHRTTGEAHIASIPRSIASCGFLQLVLGPLRYESTVSPASTASSTSSTSSTHADANCSVQYLTILS